MPFQLILEAFGAKGDSLEMLVAIQHQPLHTSNGKKKKVNTYIKMCGQIAALKRRNYF